MNIAVSGWNGAGSSTLCLILARNLNFKLLQGTQTFRYLGRKLKFDDTGKDRIDADELLEDSWGPIYDEYIDYILVNKNNYLVESDIAAFRLGKRSNYYSIFLIADSEARASRLGADSRAKDIEVLEARDKSLQEKYKKLHNIDWLSTQEIIEKYNLVLDNTDLSIKDELIAIYEGLNSNGNLDDQKTKQLCEQASADEELFWTKGKDYFINNLTENHLLIKAEEIVKEVCEVCKDKINTLPGELREIVSDI